jgi:hypothetical protein
VLTTLVELGADIGALSGRGETTLQASIRRGQHQVAQVLRELERSARTKKEAAAKEPTQQAIDHADRNMAQLIEEEERDQAAQRIESARLLHSHPRQARSMAPGWMVCPSHTG